MAQSNESRWLAAFRPILEMRQALRAAIGDFFRKRGFLEVETPLWVPAPATELHIDVIEAEHGYLRTSPEFHMKRLLAAGYDRIYQLAPCFRKGERGPLHHPEYTMLEWYRGGCDYMDMLVDTKALVQHVARSVKGTSHLSYQGRPLALDPIWAWMPVADAFIQFAGWNPMDDFDEDRFDQDLAGKIEPRLPKETPTILTDYPAQRAALARCKEEPPHPAERWELYLAGIEIANAYTELTDPKEYRRRHEQWSASRQAGGRAVYPLDREFVQAIESGLPPCAGVALGLDRLLMILCDKVSLDEILPFRTDA